MDETAPHCDNDHIPIATNRHLNETPDDLATWASSRFCTSTSELATHDLSYRNQGSVNITDRALNPNKNKEV